jgi:hypothetical protein
VRKQGVGGFLVEDIVLSAAAPANAKIGKKHIAFSPYRPLIIVLEFCK